MIYKILQTETTTKETKKLPKEMRIIFEDGVVVALQLDHEIVIIENGIKTLKITGFDRWTDANKRPIRNEMGEIETEEYLSNEITSYTEQELDEEGNTITPSVPVYSEITRTRNKTEGEIEFWLRSLVGKAVLPAIQNSL